MYPVNYYKILYRYSPSCFLLHFQKAEKVPAQGLMSTYGQPKAYLKRFLKILVFNWKVLFWKVLNNWKIRVFFREKCWIFWDRPFFGFSRGQKVSTEGLRWKVRWTVFFIQSPPVLENCFALRFWRNMFKYRLRCVQCWFWQTNLCNSDFPRVALTAPANLDGSWKYLQQKKNSQKFQTFESFCTWVKGLNFTNLLQCRLNFAFFANLTHSVAEGRLDDFRLSRLCKNQISRVEFLEPKFL